MSDKNREQEWVLQLHQAENFAAKENYLEAVGRARSLCRELESYISSDPDARVQAILLQAKGALSRYEGLFESWNSKIAARRENATLAAEEEMKRPLPLPADFR